jgi:hypothetical protein
MLQDHGRSSPPLPFCAAINHQNSIASFATLRVLNCLHSPGLRCSCCYWPFASWEALTGMRIDGWRHAVRQRERYTPQSKIWCYCPFWKNYLPHSSFVLWVVVLVLMCKIGIRVTVTTATVDWGFTPVAVCSSNRNNMTGVGQCVYTTLLTNITNTSVSQVKYLR